jgi:hypothetical protein
MTAVVRPRRRARPPGSDGCPRQRRKGRTNPDSGLRPCILRFGPAAWRMCRAHPNETQGLLHHAAGETRLMPVARRAAALPIVAADRNPFIQGSLGAYPGFRDHVALHYEIPEGEYVGNAIALGQDGQNVLFLDGRVTFETRSSCAVDGDNIYLVSVYADRGSPRGVVPTVQYASPLHERDSLLINDPNSFSSGVKK